MRWKPHVRFGERAGETDRQKRRHRAPARLHHRWGYKRLDRSDTERTLET